MGISSIVPQINFMSDRVMRYFPRGRIEAGSREEGEGRVEEDKVTGSLNKRSKNVP
jgi:hypothetical protein